MKNVFLITLFLQFIINQNVIGSSTQLGPLPLTYEQKSAENKLKDLWLFITSSEYKNKLPPFQNLGAKEILSMAYQGVAEKINRRSDFAPEGWVKYLHAVGSVAKIKFVADEKSTYTGIFQGTEFGLIRLSLTYNPIKRGVAPGAALKFLVSGRDSVNVSLLPSLDPQGQNYNFFLNPLSNIVPPTKGVGPQLVHRIFSKVTNYPENLYLEELASYLPNGEKVSNANYPLQIFLVPDEELKSNFQVTEHDVRESINKIKSGTTLYKVYASKVSNPEFYSSFNIVKNARALENSYLIGKIVTTSEFKSSSFGDSRLFFRHQAFLNN